MVDYANLLIAMVLAAAVRSKNNLHEHGLTIYIIYFVKMIVVSSKK